MHEFVDTVMALDADSSVRSIIVTGRGKAFAAGADIREMANLTAKQVEWCCWGGAGSPGGGVVAVVVLCVTVLDSFGLQQMVVCALLLHARQQHHLCLSIRMLDCMFTTGVVAPRLCAGWKGGG
jgi:hypothetical protein